MRRKEGGKVVFNKSKTFKKHGDAVTWGRKIEGQLEEDGIPKDEKTLRALIEEFLDTNEQFGGRMNRDELLLLKRLLKWPIVDRIAAKITHDDFVQCFKYARINFGIAAPTVMNYAARIGTIQNFHGLNPLPLKTAKAAAGRAGIISSSNKRTRRPTNEELTSITTHLLDTGDEWLADCLWFSIYTCRRQGEIAKLDWRTIDALTGRGLAKDIKHPRKGDPRKLAVNKLFPINEQAAEILNRQDQTRETVFGVSAHKIRDRHSRIINERIDGIDDLRFHDYRREAISRLFEQGLSIPEVQKYSLHSTWESLQVYVNLTLEESPERVEYNEIRDAYYNKQKAA